jgi:5-methylcytosine-specific restriction endonuclease McrA
MNQARESSRRLAVLLRCEQGAMADFLVALSEFDRQRLWVQLGHASVFYYLHRDLKLSKGAAHYRKVAARLIQEFPEVIGPFREGKLCISSVVELARVITPENSEEVLPRFFYLSKQEAKAVAVEICPAAVIPRREVVTEVVTEAATEVLRAPPFHLDETLPHASPAPAPPEERASFVPLTSNLQRLHMTVSKQFIDKLDAARQGQGHAQPCASAEKVIEAALDLLLAQQAKRRAEVKRPQKNPRPAKNPGHVTSAVKRAVWSRDEGKWTWPLDSGGTCGSTLRLEIDHVVPRGRGGPSTIDGCRLLCAAHNQLAARQVYGDDWMDQFTSSVQVKVPVAREGAAPGPILQPSRTFASSSASRLRSSRSFVKRTVTSRMMAEAPAMAPSSSRTSWMVNSMESGAPSFREAGTARMSWP